MNTVFVIEQGSYSAYRVVGVYSTREKAERVVSVINRPDADGEPPYDAASIAEWPLDPGADELNAGLELFSILMDFDGRVESVRATDDGDLSYGLCNGLSVWQRSAAPAYRGKHVSDAVSGHVWAEDAGHAAKIANEYRTRAIAEGRMRSWEEAS